MNVNVDMYWLIGTSLTVLGVFLTATIALFKHIDNRFDKLETAQGKTDQKTEDLRTEVYREFAPRTELNGFRKDIGKLFERLDELNAAVHELVGYLKQRKEHDA